MQVTHIFVAITIEWGATDGGAVSEKFLSEMKTLNPSYVHVFDYIHLEKSLRNELLKPPALGVSVCAYFFSVYTLPLFNSFLGIFHAHGMENGNQ